MAAMTGAARADELAEQAREIRFGRTLATVIAGFFWAIGWLAGFFWNGLVFCALGVRLGFREGTGRAAPAQDAEAAPGPPRPSKL